jgi:hypothetical protein
MKIQPNSKIITTDEGVWVFEGGAEANQEGERVFACGAGTYAIASGFNTEAVLVHPEGIVSATHPGARAIKASYAVFNK